LVEWDPHVWCDGVDARLVDGTEALSEDVSVEADCGLSLLTSNFSMVTAGLRGRRPRNLPEPICSPLVTVLP